MSNQRARLLLLLIIVLGVGLRAWHLGDRSLWFDEAFSWRLIQFPWADLVARTAADVHPPLYYLFLKSWAIVFGSSLLSLRLFSVTAAGACLAAMYLFASYAWTMSRTPEALSRGRALGLTAALLLALSPWQIAFAWEARMYTLGTFFTLLSAYFLLAAVRQKRQQPQWYIAFALSAAAMLYTHYYTVFSLLAQALFIVGALLVQSRGRIGELLQSRTVWYGLLATVIAGGLFAPWLPTFLRQNSQVQQQFWIPPLSGWSVPDTFTRMLAPTAGAPAHQGWMAAVSLIPLAAAFAALAWLQAGWRADTRQSSLKKTDSSREAAALVALMALVPFAASITLSLIGRSLYQDRYFVFAQPFLIVTAAVIIFRFRSAWLRRILIAALALLLLVAFARSWQELDIAHKPGAHGAATYVFSRRAADEPVYASSPFIFFAIAHYAQEEFQNAAVPKLYSETGQLVHFAGGPILTTNDIAGPDIFTNPTAKSFWMVDTTGFGGRELAVPGNFRRSDHQVFPEVYGYQGDVIVNHYQRQ